MADVPSTYGPRGAVPKTYRSRPGEEPASGRAFVRKAGKAVADWLMNDTLPPAEDRSDPLLDQLLERKGMQEAEHARRRDLFRRWDNLFHAQTITLGGADHWADDPSAKIGGRAHISVNLHASYVAIPASLQAVVPVINVVPTGPSKREREQATRIEDIYFRWREEIEYDLIDEDVCLIKALYGDTAAKVYWDPQKKMPMVEVLDSPENLYLGYGNSSYTRIDWAIYCFSMSPQAIREEFGLEVEMVKEGQDYKPVVYHAGDHSDPLNQTGLYGQRYDDIERARRDTAYERAQIEVYDYWYKKPGKKAGSAPTTWNAIYVGDYRVKDKAHPEYDGELPYVPIVNQRIPGSPYGKPELYDAEQLLRVKDELLTDGQQMIHDIVQGQKWQLVGEDAPDEVPSNAVPQANKVATPGAGNRLEALQPFVPQFALEDYLQRVDRDLAALTGLNDLILGLAPANALSSSKAVTALIAQYVARINPKRKLKYAWDKKVWRLAAKIWEAKDVSMRELIGGNYRLEIKAPELTPRDQLEIAQTALGLMQNRVWSMERTMDATGVEDVTDEKAVIREEQADAALNPQAVMTQGQLLALFMQMGMVPPQGAAAQSANAARTLQRPPKGSSSLNAPENQSNVPQEALPANAQDPNATMGAGLKSQTMLADGETQGRILTEQEL